MEAIIIGTIAALIVLCVFLLGAICGAKAANLMRPGSTPAESSEAEKQRMREDQAAFESLLAYNADVVYGTNNGMGGKEV